MRLHLDVRLTCFWGSTKNCFFREVFHGNVRNETGMMCDPFKSLRKNAPVPFPLAARLPSLWCATRLNCDSVNHDTLSLAVWI